MGICNLSWAESVDAQLDSGSETTHAVEINFQSIGEFGGQSAKNAGDSDGGYRSTDGLISLTARKFFTREFDLSVTAPIYGLVSNDGQVAGGNPFYTRYDLYPYSLGARYQLSYFDLIKPSFQIDIGEAFVHETAWALYNNGASDRDPTAVNDVRKFFRPFGKVALGLDLAFSEKSPMYAGFKAGYLFMKEFGALNMGLQMGYRF